MIRVDINLGWPYVASLLVNGSWIALLVPIVGALATYLVTRESRVRRARLAAREGLSLHKTASELLGTDNPTVDQVRAQARDSLAEWKPLTRSNWRRLCERLPS